MANNKKYIVLQNGYSIAFDNENCYVDDAVKASDENETRSADQRASNLKEMFYNNYFKKHFKNIVVLTAAGTSLDNGTNKGKTRDGLWDDLRNDIKKVIKTIQPCNLTLKQIVKNKDIEGLLSYIIPLFAVAYTARKFGIASFVPIVIGIKKKSPDFCKA